MKSVKLKRLLIILLTLVPGVLFADVNPEGGWYARFDAGFSNAKDPELSIPEGPLPADLGDSPVIGGGIGYAIVAGLRADFTVSHRSGFEHVSGFPAMPKGRADFRSTTGLATVLLDILSSARVSPFGGFGLGVAYNELDTIEITNPDGSRLGTIGGKSKTGFAWQLCAGVGVDLTDRFSVELGYHYLDAGEYESQDQLIFADGTSAPGKDRASFRANEFQIGIRYTF